MTKIQTPGVTDPVRVVPRSAGGGLEVLLDELGWMMIVHMDPDEFRRLLCRALHLPEDTSEYAILALVETAYHFYLLNRPAEAATSIEALDTSEGAK